MTPSDLIERHVTAFLARIKSDPQLADAPGTAVPRTVFDGDVDGDPERYVNVFHDTGFFSPRTVLGEHQDVDITFTVHAVGTERWQATWVDGRVLALLNDHVLEVPGRRCFKLGPAGTQPVAKDDTTQRVKFLAVRRFILHSIPRGTP